MPHDAELPPHDFHFPLLSLPLYFNIDDESIPAKRSYLSADADRAAHWRAQVPAAKQLRVGLVWSGGVTHQRNMFRSVGIDRYAKAFGALENVAFFSLQKGAQDDVAAAQQNGFTIADHTGEFETFDDTAAFIDSLDLVITVCTSVAHLAAALGKPTWILLDANPHWVWQLERTDSPWYPTATLYRQKQFAQWEPVFDDLTRDLRRWPRSTRARRRRSGARQRNWLNKATKRRPRNRSPFFYSPRCIFSISSARHAGHRQPIPSSAARAAMREARAPAPCIARERCRSETLRRIASRRAPRIAFRRSRLRRHRHQSR